MEVTLRGNLGKPKYVVIGVPGPGLVGPLSLSFLIDSLGLEEIGFMKDEELPPVIPIHGGKPMHAIRLHGSGELLAIISEVGMGQHLVKKFAEQLEKFLKHIQPEMVVVVGGIENAERGGLYVITNRDGLVKNLRGFKKIDHGATTGTMALLLLSDLPVLCLLAPVSGQVDVASAVELTKAVGRLIKKKVEIPPEAYEIKGEPSRISGDGIYG